MHALSYFSPKIKEALAALPQECVDRHLEKFATTINNRLANVSPDLKYRYLDAALQIIGSHERVQNASEVFQYYKDLVTEIELITTIDGSDRVSPDEPFGLFVNIRHTQEIERESGGFQRYLQNQQNNNFAYNYGRNTENYRDKFEKSARAILEEQFEVISLTFHSDKVQSRSDAELGWRITPYAYFLMKPKGPEIDSIAALKLDLDFLDTSGYVVLPVSSSAIPIDSSGEPEARPVRDLAVMMTLDEREGEKENLLYLDVKATGLGLVPPLDSLIDTEVAGFSLGGVEDRDLLVEELDTESEDGAPRSVREWRLVLAPAGDVKPAKFTFPEVKIPVREKDGLTLQRFDDVDLVTVPATIEFDGSVKAPISKGLIFGFLALAILIIAGVAFALRRGEQTEVSSATPEIPEKLTPVTLLSFLERLKEFLPEEKHVALDSEIESLQDRFFGPQRDDAELDLHSLASRWQNAVS